MNRKISEIEAMLNEQANRKKEIALARERVDKFISQVGSKLTQIDSGEQSPLHNDKIRAASFYIQVASTDEIDSQMWISSARGVANLINKKEIDISEFSRNLSENLASRLPEPSELLLRFEQACFFESNSNLPRLIGSAKACSHAAIRRYEILNEKLSTKARLIVESFAKNVHMASTWISAAGLVGRNYDPIAPIFRQSIWRTNLNQVATLLGQLREIDEKAYRLELELSDQKWVLFREEEFGLPELLPGRSEAQRKYAARVRIEALLFGADRSIFARTRSPESVIERAKPFILKKRKGDFWKSPPIQSGFDPISDPPPPIKREAGTPKVVIDEL